MGIPTVLEAAKCGGMWQKVGASATDGDGRSGALMSAADVMEPGLYRLTFETGRYFLGRHGRAGFYPRVVVEFEVKKSECREHFHVPVLLSPFSYTTYRGS